MTRATGCHPDRQSTRDRELALWNYGRSVQQPSTVTVGDAIIQPIVRVQNQGRAPACVGYSWAACIDAFTGGDPLCSGVSIWREARRRQGEIEHIDEGTRLEYALDGLVARGWDPYRPGEEEDAIEAGRQDDLADELFAADQHVSLSRVRYRIDPKDAIESIEVALSRGDGVVFAAGIREPYYRHQGADKQLDRVLGTESIGGDDNRHAMRVAGMWRNGGRRIFLLHNSWGKKWGGCHLPTGHFVDGCCWVDETALRQTDDLSVLAKP